MTATAAPPDPPAEVTFTDAAGDTWAIPVTPRSVALVKLLTGIDPAVGRADPAALARRFADNPARVREAAVGLVKDRAAAAGVGGAALFRRIDGPALARVNAALTELAVACPPAGDAPPRVASFARVVADPPKPATAPGA